MKILTPCIALSVCGISSFAHASFDLMFLPDATTNRVVRFDPSNRIVLGSFGDFSNAGVRYVGVGTQNRAYITDEDGTTIMNAYTGTVLNGRAFPDDKVSVSPQGNRLYTIPGYYGRYSGTLDSLSGTASNYDLYSVVAISDTYGIAIGTNANNQLVANVYVNSSTSSVATHTSVAVVNPGRIGATQASVGSTTARWMVTYNALIGAGLSRQYVAATTDTTTGVTTLTGGALNFGTEFSITASVMAMPAHEGWWLVGDDAASATTTRISYYGRDFTRQFTYTTTAVNVPTLDWGGHIVLAPEPGTMAALGIGLGVLLRKRRATGVKNSP